MAEFDFGEFLRQKRVQDALNAHDPNYNPDDATHWISTAQKLTAPELPESVMANREMAQSVADSGQNYQVPEFRAPQAGPEESRYQSMLKEQPMISDYHPGKLRSILAAVAGVGSGLNTMNPVAAAQTNDLVRNQPYNQRLQEFNQSLGRQGELAKGEVAGQERTGKLEHEHYQSVAESERAGAEHSRRLGEEYKTGPIYFDREMQLQRLRNEGRASRATQNEGPYDIELQDGTIVQGATWNKETGQFSSEGVIYGGKDKDGRNVVKSYRKNASSGGEPMYQVEDPVTKAVRWTPRSQAAGGVAPKTQDIATALASLAERRSNQDENRLDRSYQFHSKQLEAIAKPLSDVNARVARLEDTLNTKGMTADALVAPELLSIVAGGQGSNFRMTEAEIARVIGGRTNFEKLKAEANKWALDPTQAQNIQPEQRREIRALLSEVRKRLDKKLAATNSASEKLLDPNSDENAHKRALSDVHKAMAEADAPTQSQDTVEYKGRQIPKTITQGGVTLTFDSKTQRYIGKK